MSSEIQELVADVREQILFLREIGVFSMNVRGIEIGESGIENVEMRSVALVSNRSPEIPVITIPMIETAKPVEPRVPGHSRLADLPSLSSLSKRTEIAPPKSMAENIEKPVETAQSAIVEKQIELAIVEKATALPQPTETIEQIRAEIGPDCVRCKLATLGRSKVVNSTGNFNAQLMFVGEAPGADEDEQGFPFVGRAGKLLTDIMGAIGFSRDDVFIGNINRCRPPGNRAPETDETLACKPFLKREIAVVRPKVIVVLGATAAQNLLETKVPIGKLRGNFHDYLGTKVMPTFHPAYLLRDPHKKREVWEDMKMVRDYLAAQK